MNQEPLTLYKLIVLYMLDRVTFPLTTAQISEFILEKEYTNFLTLQTAISELTETGLAESRTLLNRTQPDSLRGSVWSCWKKYRNRQDFPFSWW